MSFFHKDITIEYWSNMTIEMQLANIGSEAERAINLMKESSSDYLWHSIDRLLDLIDLTIKVEKNFFRLRELSRLREVFVDYIINNNSYNTTDNFFHEYYLFFGLRARAQIKKKQGGINE